MDAGRGETDAGRDTSPGTDAGADPIDAGDTGADAGAGADTGTDVGADAADAGMDAAPPDPCRTFTPAETVGCNGEPTGPAEAGEFGGRCVFDDDCAEGRCIIGRDDPYGICYLDCEEDAGGAITTSTCPAGSRCWPLGGGLCLPDCREASDCASEVCISGCDLPMFERAPGEDRTADMAEACGESELEAVPRFGRQLDVSGDLATAENDFAYAFDGCEEFVDQVVRVRLFTSATFRFTVSSPAHTVEVRRTDRCEDDLRCPSRPDSQVIAFFDAGEWDVIVHGPPAAGAFTLTVRQL